MTDVSCGRLPDIPRKYSAPEELLGGIPARCAEGFEVTRIANTPEGIAQAKGRGQVVAFAGDLNPDNPEEPLILNEEMFAKSAEGMLTYRGDLLVVWRTEYAEDFRKAGAEKAQAASAGVKLNRVTI